MSYQLEKYVNFGLKGTLNANKRNKQISYNPLWTNVYYYDIYGYSTLSSNIKNNLFYYDIYEYKSTLSSTIKITYITMIYMNINPLFLLLLKITYITMIYMNINPLFHLILKITYIAMIYMNINPLFLLLLKITYITMIYVSEMLLKIASYYHNIQGYSGRIRLVIWLETPRFNGWFNN